MLQTSHTRSDDLRKSMISLILPLACVGGAVFSLRAYAGLSDANRPLMVGGVSHPAFEATPVLALVVLAVAALLDGTRCGNAIQRTIGDIVAPLKAHSDQLIRALCGLFFVALWAKGGAILNAELPTTSAAVPLVQLLIAFCMLWRETLVVAAAGIVGLLGLALHDHGMSHLVDGPIFIAIAMYFVLLGFKLTPLGTRPLDAARWLAALTVMGASVARFSDPDLSLTLFGSHSAVAVGFDTPAFLPGVGAAGFALGLAMLWTPLCRRVSALILTGLFIGAMAKVGKVDAIGYLPIIGVVLAVAADEVKTSPETRTVDWAPVGVTAALSGLLVACCALHALLLDAPGL